MKKLTSLLMVMAVIVVVPAASIAGETTPVQGEKKVFDEYRGFIPKDRVKSIDDLYKKSREVNADPTKAVILEFRSSEAEFNSGHVDQANLMVKSHIVTLRWPDPNTELWVFSNTARTATYFAGMLTKYGYKNVYLVDGGLADWVGKGYPLVNKVLGEVKITKVSDRIKAMK